MLRQLFLKVIDIIDNIDIREEPRTYRVPVLGKLSFDYVMLSKGILLIMKFKIK